MTTCEKCGGKLLEAGDVGVYSVGEVGHRPGCPDGIACIHGALKRSCEICERDARIAELERQLAESQARLYSAVMMHGPDTNTCGMYQEAAARWQAMKRQLADARAELERVKRMIESLRQICLEAGVSLAIIDAALRGETGQ
jgi:wobble nucleotide-excising tRNase